MSSPIVLVVDGIPPLYEALCEFLQKDGFDVLRASGGKDALCIFKQTPVSVVLSPDKLSDMVGLALVRKLTSQLSDARIILVSANSSNESAREALLAGAYDYISWPVTDTTTLISVVHRAVCEFTIMQRNRELLQQIQAESSVETPSAPLTVVDERHMQELTVLRAISTDLSTLMDVPRILHAISNNLPKLFKYELMAVLLDVDGKWQLFRFPIGKPEKSFVEAGIENLLTLHSMFTGRPCTRKDVQNFQPDDVVSIPGDSSSVSDIKSKLRTHVTFPLVSGGETIGCISLCSQAANAFSSIDVQLFSLIAYQLASAVYNVKLYHSTKKLAITDYLTGLYNRRHFDELLEHEYFRANRYGYNLSLTMIDIDYFKNINDTLGHASGDLVLQQVGHLLHESAREVDVVARYGGEEFVLLLPDTSLEQASILAERLRLTVQGHPFVTSQHKVNLTISMGVAALDESKVQTKEMLVNRADESLLVAKRQGRNKVCLYTPQSGVVEAEKQGLKEHRRFPRVPMKLPVRYVPISEEDMKVMFSVSQNMSVEGAAFEVKEALSHGSFVLLDMTLPFENQGERVRTIGQVVWSKEGQTEGEKSTVGVRLMPLSSESHGLIKKLVEAEVEEQDIDEIEKD